MQFKLSNNVAYTGAQEKLSNTICTPKNCILNLLRGGRYTNTYKWKGHMENMHVESAIPPADPLTATLDFFT